MLPRTSASSMCIWYATVKRLKHWSRICSSWILIIIRCSKAPGVCSLLGPNSMNISICQIWLYLNILEQLSRYRCQLWEVVGMLSTSILRRWNSRHRSTRLRRFCDCYSQFTSRSVNCNSLPSDVRTTFEGPPIWLIGSASEDYL